MNCLLIDHYDSFTHNVAHWISKESDNLYLDIVKWDEDYSNKTENCSLIIVSPGPGMPEDYPKTLKMIKEMEGKTPVFGICLGMQMMLVNDNCEVVPQQYPIHGKTTSINTKDSILFKSVPNNFSVARYHSLGAEESNSYKVIAAAEKIVMGIESDEKKQLGVQFHPESFLTDHSEQLAQNVIRWAEKMQ